MAEVPPTGNPYVDAAVMAVQLADMIFGGGGGGNAATAQQVNERAAAIRQLINEQSVRARNKINLLAANNLANYNNTNEYLSSVIREQATTTGIQVGEGLKDVISIITSQIDTNTKDINDNVISQTAAIARAVESSIFGLEGNINNLAQDIDTSIFSNVGNVLDVLSRVFDDFQQTINIENIIDVGFLDDVFRRMDELILGQILTTESILGNVGDILNRQIDINEDIYAGIIDAVDVIGKSLPGVASEVGEDIKGAADVLSDVWQRTSVLGAILGGIKDDDPDTEIIDEALIAGRNIWAFGDELLAGELDACMTLFNSTMPDNQGVRVLMNSILNILMLGMLPIEIGKARAQSCLQAYGVSNPYNVLEPGDAAHAMFRGLIEPREAVLNIRMKGYTELDAGKLLQIAEQIPDITLLFSMWLRGVIGEDELDLALKSHGYSAGFSAGLKEIIYFIPPVQDLITMAVREVFSPDIAREFGQFEDYPIEFDKWAKQQGVSGEWARNYWAAHWALPSPQMVFEMLHRGFVTPDIVEKYLRAADVMPYWREPMIGISYNPLTRVDLRRMDALGTIDDARLLKGYKDIGYNPDDAELMFRFTKDYNNDESILDVDVARDLTRSTIIGFYKKGIIPKAVASGLLIQAGINAAAAALFIVEADLTLELQDRDIEIDIVIERFKVDAISFETAQDDLTKLGLEERELKLAQLKLSRLSTSKIKTPSKADLDKFSKAALISDTEYLEQLSIIGYPAKWARMYLDLLKTGAANSETA